jgi:hypothetical protein
VLSGIVVAFPAVSSPPLVASVDGMVGSADALVLSTEVVSPADARGSGSPKQASSSVSTSPKRRRTKSTIPRANHPSCWGQPCRPIELLVEIDCVLEPAMLDAA